MYDFVLNSLVQKTCETEIRSFCFPFRIFHSEVHWKLSVRIMIKTWCKNMIFEDFTNH